MLCVLFFFCQLLFQFLLFSIKLLHGFYIYTIIIQINLLIFSMDIFLEVLLHLFINICISSGNTKLFEPFSYLFIFCQKTPILPEKIKQNPVFDILQRNGKGKYPFIIQAIHNLLSYSFLFQLLIIIDFFNNISFHQENIFKQGINIGK